jgi:hypothetical protein
MKNFRKLFLVFAVAFTLAFSMGGLSSTQANAACGYGYCHAQTNCCGCSNVAPNRILYYGADANP